VKWRNLDKDIFFRRCDAVAKIAALAVGVPESGESESNAAQTPAEVSLDDGVEENEASNAPVPLSDKINFDKAINLESSFLRDMLSEKATDPQPSDGPRVSKNASPDSGDDSDFDIEHAVKLLIHRTLVIFRVSNVLC